MISLLQRVTPQIYDPTEGRPGREPKNSEGRRTSALVRIPDSGWTLRDFRKVPETDIGGVDAYGAISAIQAISMVAGEISNDPN
jgi:hypothetical protein